jgi:hypothetical protein
VLKRWEFLHSESLGIAYFLDSRTKAGIDMIGEDRIDTIKQLEDLQFFERNFK